MSHLPPPAAPPRPQPPLPTPGPVAPRRAYRDLEEPIVGGVAAGLARHLGLPVLWTRVGFVVAVALGGIGIPLYAAFWIFMPAQPRFAEEPPGIQSATRGGRRPGRFRRLTDIGPVIVLTVVTLAVLFGISAALGGGAVVWPLVIGLVGVALLWRQADEAQRERWLDASGKVNPARVVLGEGGWPAYARLGAGVLLIALSVGMFALRSGSISVARDVTVAALLGVVGLAIVVGPWIFRLATELGDERAERVRTQERADVAAHLHDSVLQTLALIQKSAADAPTVARLARSQERDLRAWLYSGEATDERSVASALRGVAAEVEDAHGITVDVVTVGDAPYASGLRAVVAATRESITNAAKHAGVDRVDVYAEIRDDAVEVFVRDRGAGFDPAHTPADRHGVRDSIVGRMDRHGGTGEVRSSVGAGTEVRLHQPRRDPAEPADHQDHQDHQDQQDQQEKESSDG